MKQDYFKRIEQKYLFPAGYKQMILTWLEHVCMPDPLYPSGAVSSLYYDTPGLFHFHEGRNGEFMRCYLEIKRKQGVLSEKQRTEVIIPTRVLVEEPFSDEQILALPTRVFDLGYQASGVLVPVVMVHYHRRRYLDPASQASIAVDTEIRCTRANETFVHGVPPVHFDIGVMETKGMNRSIPGVLNPIGSYLTKQPFSKYGMSLESFMQPLGRRA
jgi:hypothetical protein